MSQIDQSQHTERWSCEICFNKFDPEVCIPLLFKHCGHTACINCIRGIVTQAKEENKAYINCYKCRSTHTFTDRETDNFMSFPRNYTLIQLMERHEDKQDCQHKAITRNIICLDNKCKNKTLCCFICYKQRHLSCLNELVVQADKFTEVIDVEPLNSDLLFKSLEIKAIIAQKVQEMKTRLDSFVDFCEASIQGESKQLENLTAQNYFEKAAALKSTYDSESGKIVLSHKNKEYIEVFAKKLSNLLTENIWEAERNIENTLLMSNYAYFLKIRTPASPEDLSLFDRVSSASSLVLENFLLTNFEVENYSSQEEVFRKLRDCWKPEQLPLKDLRVMFSSTIKKEIETIACEAVRQALLTNWSILEIENDIAAKFSAQVFYQNASNWKCMLSFRELPDLKENDCAIIINLKVTNGMFVCIYYPKEAPNQPQFSNRRLSYVELPTVH